MYVIDYISDMHDKYTSRVMYIWKSILIHKLAENAILVNHCILAHRHATRLIASHQQIQRLGMLKLEGKFVIGSTTC